MLAVVAVAGIIAIALLVTQLIRFGHAGGEQASVWFYDPSTQRLYGAPRDTIPPDRSSGRRGSEGVRAIVVCFRGEQNDPQKRRIAYLETNTPELKNVLERVRAARASGHPSRELVPTRDSDFVRTNTLVKRLADEHWVAASTPEGKQIMSEWRSWRGPAGQAPIISLP